MLGQLRLIKHRHVQFAQQKNKTTRPELYYKIIDAFISLGSVNSRLNCQQLKQQRLTIGIPP